MVIPKTKAEIGRCLKDKMWRMNNLYTIVDESGSKRPYRRRWVQHDLAINRHGLDVVLKSRQHGISSESDIDMLDDCIFTPDLQCGIVAHTKIDAQEIFQTKVKLPYFELPEFIRERNRPLKSDGCTLRLANGSSIRVAVSFRSATTHRLHISELGKICAKYPKRAEEIKTGTMPSVHPQLGGKAIVEGTAEGSGGYFYDLCIQAQSDTANAQKENRSLNPLQYKFHFYSWNQDPKNVASPVGIVISEDLNRYFEELDEKGIVTSIEQRAWYAFKRDGAGGLGKLIKREHPTLVEEAFEQSVEGAVYGSEMEQARSEGRIGIYPWDPSCPVYTFWDLGYGDATCAIFVQFIRGEIRIIDFYSVKGRGAAYHSKQVNSKDYVYKDSTGESTHYAPHDIMNHEKGTGIILKDTYESLGIKFNVVEHPRLKSDGIDAVRNIFNSILFNEKETKELTKALSFYRYEWDDDRLSFKKDPIHDWASDAADAVQTMALQYRFSRIGGELLGYPHPIPVTAGLNEDPGWDEWND